MDEPFGLDSSPQESTKRAPTPTRFQPTFLMKREGKWVVAGAHHHPLCFEGKTESRSDANRIEKEWKGVSKVITHSLSELTPHTHPPPSSTRTTRFNASLCFKNPPKPPVLQTARSSSTISSKTTRFGVPDGNHPLPPTFTHTTCFDVSSCVENTSGPPQCPSEVFRAPRQGPRLSTPLSSPPSPLHPTPSRIAQTDMFLCVENPSKPLLLRLSCPSSTTLLKTTHITSLIVSLGDNHPRFPTSSRLTCIDVNSRVENHSGLPQPPPDTTQTFEQGYKPPNCSSTLSPLCLSRTDVPPHVIDVSRTTVTAAYPSSL